MLGLQFLIAQTLNPRPQTLDPTREYQRGKGVSKSVTVSREKTLTPGTLCTLDRLRIGEVPRREKLLFSGTDPASYITQYTLVYEDHTAKKLNSASGAEW